MLHLLAHTPWRAHCPPGLGTYPHPGAGRNRRIWPGLSSVLPHNPQQGFYHNEKVGRRHPRRSLFCSRVLLAALAHITKQTGKMCLSPDAKPLQVPNQVQFNITYGPAVRENGKYQYNNHIVQAGGPWHPNPQKSALVCVTANGFLKLFYSQNSNNLQETQLEMESVTSSDDLITHAAMCSDRGKAPQNTAHFWWLTPGQAK